MLMCCSFLIASPNSLLLFKTLAKIPISGFSLSIVNLIVLFSITSFPALSVEFTFIS